MMFRRVIPTVLACGFLAWLVGQVPADEVVPQIDGDWWQVAGNPDFGEFTSPKQEPVDMAGDRTVPSVLTLYFIRNRSSISCSIHNAMGNATTPRSFDRLIH